MMQEKFYKRGRKRRFLKNFEKPAFFAVFSVVFRVKIHEDCVLADELDFVPRDNAIVLSSEQAEALEPAVNNQRTYTRRLRVNLKIIYISYAAAVASAYNFLVAQCRETAIHMYYNLS